MEWKISPGLTGYPDALATMAARVKAIQAGEAQELVWLVEHPPLYTLGTSAKPGDVLGTQFPTFETGRGGQVTYHGPGQRVVYLMLNLKKRANLQGREPDLRAYVKQLEQWIIVTLSEFGIDGFLRDGRVGVWVGEGLGIGDWGLEKNLTKTQSIIPNPEAKIAALGVRVQKWVTSHGISLNINPELSHYAGIVPCGLREFGVTSMAAMGSAATMEEVDSVLRESFAQVFG